jgi:hypothetical protein
MAADAYRDDVTDDQPVRRDRHEHGGSGRPDDDALALRIEQERVELGIDDFDVNEVPPATDTDPTYDPSEDEELLEEQGVFRRQESEGEVHPITDETPYPPTRYQE